jgi:hypothetical protein
MKTIDIISLGAAAFFLSLLLCGAAFDKLWQAALSAVMLTAMLIILVLRFRKRDGKRPYSVDKFCRQMALDGNEKITGSLARRMGGNVTDGYIMFNGYAVLSLFKFSDINQEDAAKAYRFCRDNSISVLYLLGKGIDRNALILCNDIPLTTVCFVKPAKLMSFMQRNNLLPPLTIKTSAKTSAGRTGLRALLDRVFDRRNAKYFLFTGVTLAVMTFIIPFKTYYTVTASVSLAAALISLLLPQNVRLKKTPNPFG